MWIPVLFVCAAGGAEAQTIAGGTITTVAGNGTAGYSGDGGPATSAELNGPQGLAVDGAGNLFIVDTGNNRIRKVDAAGTITTAAGNGTQGYSGDGGPATSAELNLPAGVALDNTGNLFISDTGNSRLRMVNPAGTITTVAGNGKRGYSGDGGPATSAALIPVGVAVDGAGNLFIAGAFRLRKVNPAGIITTVAGDGRCCKLGDGGPATSAELNGPTGVAADNAGNLFIADLGNHRIRKVNAGGTIITVAGGGTPGDVGGYSGDGGPATSAQLNWPVFVTVDNAGNLFVGDRGNNRIRKVNSAGIITTVVGNGAGGYFGDGGPVTGTSVELRRLGGVAVDAAGDLFIADSNNNRIREVPRVAASTVSLSAASATAQVARLVAQTKPEPSPPGSDQQRAEAAKQEADRLAKAHEYAAAIKAYGRAIRINPGLAGAYRDRGTAYRGLGKPESAIHEYDKAIQLDPEDAGAYFGRGNAYVTLDRFEPAIHDFDQAIKIRPDSDLAYSARSRARFFSDDVAGAQADLAKTKSLRISADIKHYDRGLKLIRQPKPLYPEKAKQKRIAGVVQLYALIGEDGTVEDLTPVRGHPLLVRAFMDVARQWVYAPALSNGKPVEATTDMQTNFTLSGQ
jgi:sugar lactone lactonase YvrE/Flp pilus assembly protein TadD